MMRFSLVFILLTVLVCCTRNRLPEDVLPQARMQAVLWDMMRADEFLMNYASKDSGFNRLQRSIELYQQVYAIHKTNGEQFEKSLNYYKRNQELFKVILDSLDKKKMAIMQHQYQNRPLDSAKKRIRLNAPK